MLLRLVVLCDDMPCKCDVVRRVVVLRLVVLRLVLLRRPAMLDKRIVFRLTAKDIF